MSGYFRIKIFKGKFRDPLKNKQKTKTEGEKSFVVRLKRNSSTETGSGTPRPRTVSFRGWGGRMVSPLCTEFHSVSSNGTLLGPTVYQSHLSKTTVLRLLLYEEDSRARYLNGSKVRNVPEKETKTVS